MKILFKDYIKKLIYKCKTKIDTIDQEFWEDVRLIDVEEEFLNE